MRICLTAPGPRSRRRSAGRRSRCYEAALQELTEDQREAVILRIEFGMSFPEVAEAMGKPSPNAARMLVVRALVHLAERMRDRRD